MLRIFTRKVPGGLVPDGLIQGFMQAYRELEGPTERLAFFRLVIREMGLSVGEVNSAVRVWDGLLARSSQGVITQAGGDGVVAAVAVRPSAGLKGREVAAPTLTTTSAPASAPASPSAPAEAFPDAAHRAADRLASACQPLYTQLFLPISQAPDGMKFLVEMRATLLELAAQQEAPSAAAPLRAMADHLRQSLAEWFSVGLLHLQPITWQDSPAALLERVMRCEAVHPLASWEELRRRLGPRRRVFAFTHPSMPGEPLVVLHTALMQRPSTSMAEILEEPAASPTARGSPFNPPHHTPPPTTAVFYSISASQPGLRGIELGQFLIKRVAEVLLTDHPSIRHLVTLSPLPNFRAWLVSRLRQEQAQPPPAPSQDTQGPADTIPGPQAPAAASAEPLLRPHEVAAVLQLARALGWLSPSPATPGRYALGRQTSEGEAGAGAGAQGSTAAGAESGAGSVGVAGGRAAATATAAAAEAAAAAAAALMWLLEGDRWLLLPAQPPVPPGTWASQSCAAAPGDSCAWRGGAGLEAGASGGAPGSPTGHPSVPEGEKSGSSEGAGHGAPGAGLEAIRASGAVDAVLRPLLLRLAARYLVLEKRRRFALCPVAHFHLRNGACLWRLNWRADSSPLGLQRSVGIMVNYDYDLPAVYDNNRKYLLQHEVHAHPQVMQLL